jgi:hypothetical protein
MKYFPFGLALLTLSSSPQSTDVKGARISLVQKTTTVMRGVVENRRESPLVSLEIGLFEPGAGDRVSMRRRYYSESVRWRVSDVRNMLSGGGARGPTQREIERARSTRNKVSPEQLCASYSLRHHTSLIDLVRFSGGFRIWGG